MLQPPLPVNPGECLGSLVFYFVNCPSADIISYGGILFCTGPSAPCLMSWFAIVTGGTGVPARDFISTRKTHVPIVVFLLGLVLAFALPVIVASDIVPP